jgi:hypothetical protein
VSLLFRCGAHLSNLALGSSRIAQSSVGSNLVQVASRFGVVRAIFPLTGRGVWLDRTCPVSTNSYCVSALLTERGPCEDRTR